ncbi:MAG: AAA family ATPase [Patescibacteria group bacterium]|nr:AAA family ATPase [Patescibacteria group bacterium]
MSGQQVTEKAHVGPEPLAILRQHGGKWGGHAATAIVLGQMLTPWAKRITQKLRRRDDFTITVAGTEEVYPDLHEWVLARLPETERKALIATTIDNGRHMAELDSYDSVRRRVAPKIRLRYDGQREQTVTLDGHRIKVSVSRDDVPNRERLPENWRQLLETIRFTASNAHGRDAVVRMLNGLLEKRYVEPGPPPLLIPSKWGGSWNRRGDLPPRTLDSVILKDGQLERLVADLGGFLAAEAHYGARSLPWHRGYLFHGEPGTGKTSVARALANHFEIPTYYLPLADLERDADLMSLVGAIQPRSMLLLEDVDAFHSATDREEKQGSASVAAMLNALDGVWTPHGLITVMTTNHRDALEPALLRAGRVDVDEEFTVLDEEQAGRVGTWLGVKADFREFVGSDPATMVQALTGGSGVLA